jgi:MFS family permease
MSDPSTDRLFSSLDGDDPSGTSEVVYDGDDGGDDDRDDSPSLLLINFNTFAMNVEYSCLMPTVYNYTVSLGGDAAFFGLVLSVFSIARMVVFVPIGWWCDKRSFREVFLATSAVGFVGCTVYGLAGYLDNKWYLALGRALAGLGASNTTLSRTYVSKCVEADKFTRMIGVQMTLDLFGVMIGPALIALIHKVEVDYKWFHFNDDTAPGYIMAALQLVMFCNFATNFNEPNNRHRRKSIRRKSLETKQEHVSDGMRAAEASSLKAVKRVMLTGGGWFFMLTVFTINFNLCFLETVATPLMEKFYDYGAIENSTFFALCAVVGVFGMLSGMRLAKQYSGTTPMSLGMMSMLAAYTVWGIWDGGATLPQAPFFVGGALCVYGLCVLTPANSSYFTKIVEYEGGAQGLFGGLWSVFMSFGKAMGPIAAGKALKVLDSGWDNYIMYLYAIPVLLLNVITFPCIWKKTRKIDSEVKRLTEESRKTEDRASEVSDDDVDDVNQSLLRDYAGMGDSERIEGSVKFGSPKRVAFSPGDNYTDEV